jgi:hypothetical protein
VVGTIAGAVAPFLPPPFNVIAAVIAVGAQIGAQLAAKKPYAQGQVTGFMVGANNPLPYMMGEAYTEGIELYRTGYGGEIKDVENPYAFIPRVISCCGPIQSMGTALAGFAELGLSGGVGTVQEATGYYNDYLYIDQQLGARPESNALQSPSGWGTPTNWGASHKLSGFAAVGWSMKWSKKGKRFAGGQLPPLGLVPQGVKVYDRRLDSTAPGGSGSCRLGMESTYVYSRNPACHASTYAYGRIMNGVPIFGIRLFEEKSINWNNVVAWANACDTNGWTVNGTIYEPGAQGQKWNNLKRICEAGGASPVQRGGVLGFDYQAPRTSLYTITRDDLAGAVSSRLGKAWKERINTLVPRYRSAAHQWSFVQADAISEAGWVATDGEEKSEERQWDLVTSVDQVTELATYDLWQRREAGPFVVPCKPHMRIFWPGDCLTLGEDLKPHPDGAIKCIVKRRTLDKQSGNVTLVLELESDAKHTAALGLTGGAPATVIWPTPEESDAIQFRNSGGATVALSSSYTRGLAGLITQSHNGDGTVDVVIPDHTRVYADGSEVAVTGATLVLAETSTFMIYYDDDDFGGGAVNFESTTTAADAYFSQTNPYRHYIGIVTTVDSGDSGGSSGGSSPPGGGGWGGTPGKEIP